MKDINIQILIDTAKRLLVLLKIAITRSFLPFLIAFLLQAVAVIGHGISSAHGAHHETPITLTISGTTSFCYSSNFTTSYTVTNLSTGTFTWNVPANCTILSGQGT